MNPLLDRESLLNQRLPTARVTVEVDGAPRDVLVRGMSSGAQDTYTARLAGGEEFAYRAYIVVKCVVDEDGKRVFTDKDLSTVADELDPAIIDAVVDKVQELSNVTEERLEAIKKNWQTLNGGSRGESASA